MLRGLDGAWIEDEDKLKELVNNFFKELFTEEVSAENCIRSDYKFVPIKADMVQELSCQISKEEIKNAAPGPDGYPAGFYHRNWKVVEQSLCSFISQMWNSPSIIASINQTDICLIPKLDKPEFVNQFRPISLCNVSYKIITKIIVNRLKPLIPNIISPYQTGFVPTRNIHENIIVAQEMIHSMYKMRGKVGFFAIKVDLAKAYDRLRWSFIQDILVEVGLPENLINIIMHCVSTVTTNVMWNGKRSTFFRPERGIRQGDPMSPYLFVLCMDKLSHLIAKEVDNKDWMAMRAGRNGPHISHLMFADDLLLFGKATEKQMECTMRTLDKFSKMSGQMVSLEKTRIYFSKNVDAQTRRRLVRQSGFQETSNIGKYLGVPLIGGAPRKRDFQHLIDKVRNKLSGWKASHLSFAGRVTLSKSVIQAIPVYSMMTTLVPKSCLLEIQKLQRGFIWGDDVNNRKLHTVSWSTLTIPKELGGLAIRDMGKMNLACIMKLGWAIK
ncbi:ribonuclease H, partial [Trifolium medium]|nr:ribonuclease H [Trifolium medium]